MSTTTEQNKTVIRQFVEAWNNRQPEAFDDLIAPDVVRHCQATPAIEIRSLDQLKEFQRQDTAIFPDSRQTLVHMVAEDDFVGYGRRMKARSAGQLVRCPPRAPRRNLTSAESSASPTARSPSGGSPGTIWRSFGNSAICRLIEACHPQHSERRAGFEPVNH
jgi:hypothetical protein